MHDHCHRPWEHSHDFGQGRKRPGESRTVIVAALTCVTMVVEIAAGIAFGSMALLADGLHMGSHAVALGISVFAYVYARRHAHDQRFSFGTGKVNALGGYTGAVLLALFAVMMAWESIERLITPLPIAFNQAIAVALLGLLVNGASVVILGQQDHDLEPHDHHHHHPGDTPHPHHHHDHNLRSAYLHVLADALTSLFAIVALLAGKFLGWNWMDPLMGVVGAVMVALWSRGLLTTTAHVLLDMQASDALREGIRSDLEHDGSARVTDLHVWAIGPGLHAVAATVVAPRREPTAHYHRLLTRPGVSHVTIEVHDLSDNLSKD